MKTIENLVDEHGLNLSQAKVVHSNIKELIVPAGAGSGKTKTLVTKVTELLKQGNSLDNFLVLTFTKKAASEMKERIKKELISSQMTDMANKIDSANISTFDAFAYNFVKQNANTIGLSSDIELLDQAIFNNIKTELLEEIILTIMLDENNSNYDFIKYFSGKTDEKDLNRSLLNTYNNLVELGNIRNLDLTKLSIKKNIFNYDLLHDEVSELSEEFIDEHFEYFNNVKQYYEYLNGFSEDFPDFTVPRFKWKDLGLLPQVKKRIQKIMETHNDLVKVLPSREDLNTFFDFEQKYIFNIIDVLCIYEDKLNNFKKLTGKYEFSDIANFLNKILMENESILKRQKEKFIYVFVDEYQDTSKVQSDFLNMLIKDNNQIRVLYVGDLKQSIYKFRNAKPDTFINKQKEVDVISLDTNYRSSSKVIKFVNDVFEEIMDDEDKYDINYKNGHIMESGNTRFNTDEAADVFLLEMYKDENSRIKNDAVEEAFVIGNKINELLENNKISAYKDVAILARNKSSFKIYLDVFKYLNIPIQIQVDQELKQTYLLKLIANILKLSAIIDNKDKYLMNDKRFLYFSIARSELFEKSDFKLFEELLNFDEPTYKSLNMDKEILQKLYEINKIIKTKSNYEIINSIVSVFEVYKKIITTKKVKEKNLQIEYLFNLSNTLADLNINSFDFVDYIYELAYNDDISLKVDLLEDNEENSVKVTNIHQSKGLEYNTLFVVGLNKEFNKGNVTLFNFTEKALFNINIKDTNLDTKVTAINEYIRKYRSTINVKDNLKEELRLLYVALTRAEKALYLVTVPKEDYLELNSFTDYLYMNDFKRFIKKTNISTYSKYLKSSDYYLHIRENNVYYNKDIDSLKDYLFDYKTLELENLKASTAVSILNDKNAYQNIKEGTRLHFDFENQNLNNKLVNRLYGTSFNNKNLKDANLYHEFEFIYENDNKNVRGIIDLLAIYEDEVHIIDYKLRDLTNDNYIKQLSVYETYLKNIYNLPIKLYLYSITDGTIKQIINE